MNKVGIIVAMEEEEEAILNIMNNIEEKDEYEVTFKIGQIGKTKVIVVKCGVGKVNAARVTQILIDKFNVEYVINVGSAGALNPLLNIGDIVIGEKLIQHDFDITAFDHAKGYIPNVGVYLDSDEYLLRIANEVSKEFTDIGFHNGVIASGDIFCTSDKMSQKINQKFKALCVDMEGASIAQVAYLSGIPFLVVRSISDIPNNNNRITYEEFLESSSRLVAKFLISMLEKISISRI